VFVKDVDLEAVPTSTFLNYDDDDDQMPIGISHLSAILPLKPTSSKFV